jgi:single-strand DNA-binding protein
MIKLLAIGHLGKDATTNQVNGKNVINFSVAHTEKFKDAAGNSMEKTIWLACAYWADKIAIAPYLLKGTQVFIEGIPEVKMFNRNDGSPGAELTVKVFSVQLLGGKKEGASGAPAAAQQQPTTPANTSDITEPIEDLPF